MYRWLCLVALAVLAAACASPPPDPSRLTFGVSADRPAPPQGDAQIDQQITTYLDSRVNQICTRGYDIVGQDNEPAEAGNVLVNWQVRCRPYELSFGF